MEQCSIILVLCTEVNSSLEISHGLLDVEGKILVKSELATGQFG